MTSAGNLEIRVAHALHRDGSSSWIKQTSSCQGLKLLRFHLELELHMSQKDHQGCLVSRRKVDYFKSNQPVSHESDQSLKMDGFWTVRQSQRASPKDP